MEMNSHFVKVNAEYRFAEHRVAKREREREREKEREEKEKRMRYHACGIA